MLVLEICDLFLCLPNAVRLPGCLAHARYLALEGKFTEADATQSESTVVGTCTATSETAVVFSRFELRRLLLLVDQR